MYVVKSEGKYLSPGGYMSDDIEKATICSTIPGAKVARNYSIKRAARFPHVTYYLQPDAGWAIVPVELKECAIVDVPEDDFKGILYNAD